MCEEQETKLHEGRRSWHVESCYQLVTAAMHQLLSSCSHVLHASLSVHQRTMAGKLELSFSLEYYTHVDRVC